MACSNSFVHPAQNYYFAEDKSLIKESSMNADENSDFLQCFVCDSLVQGKHYTLASCKTQSTRTRVIEKLGELVGERYMVVISEEDIICRSCANLINTLDRLEMEMKTVKGTVLRYLERKYRLEDGELENNDTSSSIKTNQPLNVTKTKENVEKKKNLISTNQKTIVCDKCRYSTNHQTFMIHHLRQHINQKINCDKCGVQFIGNNNQENNSHSCKKLKKSNESVDKIEEYAVDRVKVKEDNNSLPKLNPEDQDVLMKDEINIESNLSDIIDDEQGTIDGISKNVLITEENLVQNNVNSLRQILKVREDGSLEMIQMDALNEKQFEIV